CPYFAPRVYLDRLRENPRSFALAAVTLDRTPEGVMRALETGPYGRCVYRCDNDVVDHQVVLMRFGRGLSVSLTMQGASHVGGRVAPKSPAGFRGGALAHEQWRSAKDGRLRRRGARRSVRLERACRHALSLRALRKFQECRDAGPDLRRLGRVDEKQRPEDLVCAIRKVRLRWRDAIDRDHPEPGVVRGPRPDAGAPDPPAEGRDRTPCGLNLGHTGDCRR